MNHSPTEGAQGSVNSKTPEHSPLPWRASPTGQLYDANNQALIGVGAFNSRWDAALVRDSVNNTSQELDALRADYAGKHFQILTLESQLAQSEERVKALTEGLDKLTAWGMYCPDWADRNSKDEYAKDFMAALALLPSSKTN